MKGHMFTVAMERLEGRLQQGDYDLTGVPAERELAQQVGVSRMTLRKALQHMVDQGRLKRRRNGRLAVRKKSQQMQVALLSSAFISPETELWHVELSKLSKKHHFILKTFHFLHNDDPIIKSTVENFDCTFMLPPVMPDHRVTELKRVGKPVINLNSDWSGFGIPSILFPVRSVIKLLEHLEALGHRRIDCLNVQPLSYPITGTIDEWRRWLSIYDYRGVLMDYPVDKYAATYPAAYDVIDGLIRQGRFDSKALLCTTEPAAIGAMCAMIDHGLQPGVDVAVCSAGFGANPEFFRPSLTTLEYVDPTPLLSQCIEWAARRGVRWNGPWLLEPKEIKVAVRESTVPDCRARRK